MEVAVASVSREATSFGLPTPYLEVFAQRDNTWEQVLDGRDPAPPGADGAPATILDPGADDFAVGQSVQTLEALDFEEDGAPELVIAVANAGATSGPVALWVIAMRPDHSFTTEFFEQTTRGGRLEVGKGTIRLEFGVYRKRDPGCCPSVMELQTIGHDPAQDAIVVLERTRTPTPT